MPLTGARRAACRCAVALLGQRLTAPRIVRRSAPGYVSRSDRVPWGRSARLARRIARLWNQTSWRRKFSWRCGRASPRSWTGGSWTPHTRTSMTWGVRGPWRTIRAPPPCCCKRWTSGGIPSASCHEMTRLAPSRQAPGLPGWLHSAALRARGGGVGGLLGVARPISGRMAPPTFGLSAGRPESRLNHFRAERWSARKSTKPLSG